MFSSNLYNYGFFYNEDSINFVCLATAKLSDEKKHFPQSYPIKHSFNNCFNDMKFCCSGEEFLIILFCKPQQKYLDLHFKSNFLIFFA